MEEIKTRIDLPRDGRSRLSQLRLTAIAPFLVSVVALVLTIILLVAGTKPGTLQDYNVLALNTSKLGENIIEFTPTTTTAAKVKRDPDPANPLDPFGLFPTATASASGSSSTATASDPLGALGSFFSGLVNNVTASIDGSLNDAEAQLVAGVVDSLGIAEYYSLHLLNICSGNLSSPTASNASFDVTKCVSYSAPGAGLSNFSSNIPNTLKVATTNVTVPLLADLGTSGDYLGNTVTALARALIAFYIIAIIGSGITVLGSLIAIVLGDSRILLYINIGFSTLGTAFLLTGSIAVTILSELMAKIVNMIGNGIGLYAEKGGKFIALTWVAFGMILLANTFWFVVWFVEFKTWSLVLRSRMPEQRGNYLRVFKEVKDNLTLGPKNDRILMGTSFRGSISEPSRSREV